VNRHTLLFLSLFLCLFLCQLAPLTPFAAATSDDYTWSTEFAGVGFDGSISALIEFGGDLVVAGSFGRHSTQYMTDVARWDGNHWQAMGEPGFVQATALGVFDGDLYLHGFWGGAPQLPFLNWNGTGWDTTAVFGTAPGASAGYVLDMIEFDGRLVVAGGVCIDGLCRLFTYDGDSWNDVGNGPELVGSFVDVRDMLVFGGDLYAVGEFWQRQDGLPMSGLARWDGTTWSAIEGRSHAGGTLVEGLHSGGSAGVGLALAEYDGQLVIAGWFDQAGDLPVSNICSWDPVTLMWEDLGGGSPDLISSLAAQGNDLVAGGSFTSIGGQNVANVGRWNGVAWADMDGGTSDDVFELLAYQGSIIVAGKFKSAGSIQAGRIAWWSDDGFVTHAEPGGWGFDDRVHDLTVYDESLVAAGRFEFAGTTRVNRVAAWDGFGWSALGAGINGQGNEVLVHGMDLVVGGEFNEAGGNAAPYVARWDGSQWLAYGSGPPGAVTAMCVHDDELYVGGESDGTSDGFIVRWAGSTWESVSLGPYNNEVLALQSYNNQLVAGSTFWVFESENDLHGYVARYDGNEWLPLLGECGGTIADRVHNLYVHDDRLYISGQFFYVDRRWPGGPNCSPTGALTGVWDGSLLVALQPTDIGGSGPFVTLAVAATDDRMFIGGSGGGGIWSANDTSPYWEVVNGGVNNAVRALQAHDGRLYVAGDFTEVATTSTGGVFSARFGAVSTASTAVETIPGVSALRLYPNRPNPFNPMTEFRFAVPEDGPASLAVFDLTGRRITTLVTGHLTAGLHRASWDGRDVRGNTVASGVYFCRLSAGGTSVMRKATLLK